MTDSKEIAILYFARSAEHDLKKGRFGNDKLHRGVVRRLHESTLATIRKSGMPVLVFDEKVQVGDDLASRLSHAFKTTFDQGYKAVIAIGNDIPDLHTKHLMQAAAALNVGRPALGPAMDGGNYLIGIPKNRFEELELKRALAANNETNSRLSALFPEGKRLEVLSDIDDFRALEQWLSRPSTNSAAKSLKTKIQSLINLAERVQIDVRPARHFSILRYSGFRAPPNVA